MADYPLIKSGLTEALGTFAIVVYSNLNIDLISEAGQDDRSQFHERIIKVSSLSVFFVIMAMMWVGGKQISAQLSPFLSFALFLSGGLPLSNFVLNLLAQFLGTLCGFLFNQLISENIYFTKTSFKSLPMALIEGWFWFMMALVFLMTYSHKQAYRAVRGAVVPAVYAGCNLALAKVHMIYFNVFQFVLVDIAGNVRSRDEIWVTTKLLAFAAGLGGVLAASLVFRGLLNVEYPRFDASQTSVPEKKGRA